MATPTKLRVNQMPALTWHRLKMNWADVVIPAASGVPAPASISFDVPEGVGLGWFERTIESDDHHEEGDVALVGLFDKVLEQIGNRGEWEDGIGAEGSGWMHAQSTRRLFVRVPDDMVVEQPIVVRVNAEDGAAAVASIGIVAGARSRVKLHVSVDGARNGVGVAGSSIRVIAADGAHVEIDSVQTLAGDFKHLDNIGAFLDDDARLTISQTVLGAAESYTGVAVDLAGNASDCKVDTRYLGHGSRVIDFNYVMRQRGRNSTCELAANGVLMDTSAKTLRGTIDLVHGCSGSVGNEQETVLLVSEGVKNKTIPIILCDEDDVQGAHGATIGHVNPEQLHYLRSRGLSTELSEALFATAAFDYAANRAFDQGVREAIWRTGRHALGAAYDPQREGEE